MFKGLMFVRMLIIKGLYDRMCMIGFKIRWVRGVRYREARHIDRQQLHVSKSRAHGEHARERKRHGLGHTITTTMMMTRRRTKLMRMMMVQTLLMMRRMKRKRRKRTIASTERSQHCQSPHSHRL